jgi:hypothetical protein
VLAALGAVDWPPVADCGSGGFDAFTPEGADGSFEALSSLMAVWADCSSGNGRPVYLSGGFIADGRFPTGCDARNCLGLSRIRKNFASTADRSLPDTRCRSATAEAPIEAAPVDSASPNLLAARRGRP